MSRSLWDHKVLAAAPVLLDATDGDITVYSRIQPNFTVGPTCGRVAGIVLARVNITCFTLFVGRESLVRITQWNLKQIRLVV